MTGAATPTDISRAISTLEAALATQRDRVEAVLAQLATVEGDAKAANDRAWASGEAVGALREQLAALERRIETRLACSDRADGSAAHERQDFLDAESRTQRELAAVRQRLEQAEREAEQARREVQESAKAQSRAEAARQRRGRLARLLAAWRGSDG